MHYCQEETSEPLKCPLLGPGTCDSKIEDYRSFLRNVEQFKAMNSLLTAILFGENESAESFSAHHASWHKSCHLKYNNFSSKELRREDLAQISPSQEQANAGQLVSSFACFVKIKVLQNNVALFGQLYISMQSREGD